MCFIHEDFWISHRDWKMWTVSYPEIFKSPSTEIQRFKNLRV